MTVNVLLYVVDALRADHLSCYGYERETTPTIDGLASEGVRFEHSFTPATWTRPVAASLLTGLYPPAHGTRTRDDRFAPPRATLAEAFSAAGYETAGISSMGNVSSATGFDRGFDRFDDLYRDDDVIDKRHTTSAAEEELKSETGVVALPRAEDITDAFERWLRERSGDGPFFGFCWSIEPHIPYDPPAGYDRFGDRQYRGPVDGSRECLKEVRSDADLERLKALYDGEIRYNDDCLGELLDLLRSEGEFDETLVVVVGDHGDAFDEHGRLTHGHAPYEELVRVPWVMRPPGGVEGGQVVPDMVSLVDVYPTLLEYAIDAAVESPEPIAGQSRASALHGDQVDDHEQVFFETNSYDMQNAFYGVRTPGWKYIEIEGPDRRVLTVVELLRYVRENGLLSDILRNPLYYWRRYRYDEAVRLYDLNADPAERENLADERPARRDEFGTTLRQWREGCESYREGVDVDRDRSEIDARTREQLRELGYTE